VGSILQPAGVAPAPKRSAARVLALDFFTVDTRLGRVLGVPSVRAACGGNLSLSWLLRRVVRCDQGTV
jgi:hypothetical protein